MEHTVMKWSSPTTKLLVCAAIGLGVLIPRQVFAQG